MSLAPGNHSGNLGKVVRVMVIRWLKMLMVTVILTKLLRMVRVIVMRWL